MSSQSGPHQDDGETSYMVDMVRRASPPNFVVPRTPPVVSFGDPRGATVATLAINPSLREFCAKDDPAGPGGSRLLAGKDRRLLSLEALGVESLADATSEQVQQVIEDCASYFERPNAYWRYFGVLQRLLVAATENRYTYRKRGAGEEQRVAAGACHLDLVQWATDPVWRFLPPQVKADLLNEGVPYLRRQLEHHTNIRVVLLNGQQVVDQVVNCGLAELEPVGSTVYRWTDDAGTVLYTGQSRSCAKRGLSRPVQFLGWSVNLQGNHGANSMAFVEGVLAPWLAKRMDLPPRGGETAA